MSVPGPLDGVPGGSPRAALSEWLRLCDHITRAGGHILVLDPPGAARPGFFRTAFVGVLFPQPHTAPSAVFLLSRPREGEAPSEAGPLLTRAGLVCQQAAHPFAGQADFFSLGRNRYLLTLGKGTAPGAAAEVQKLLPAGARLLEVDLQEHTENGLRALCPLSTAAGDGVILAHAGGLKNRAIEELSRFSGGELEVIPLSPEDGQAYAGSALSVRGTAFLPVGLSAALRGQLLRRGFGVVEVELAHLLQAGGPRDLVNELPGFVLSDDAPSYGMRREELYRLAATYPESAEAG
jgi:hypothetical protein